MTAEEKRTDARDATHDMGEKVNVRQNIGKATVSSRNVTFMYCWIRLLCGLRSLPGLPGYLRKKGVIQNQKVSWISGTYHGGYKGPLGDMVLGKMHV